MAIERIGYGMGRKDFEAANCLRAILGEKAAERPRVAELCCNLDDMRPEDLAHATATLMAEGALDAWLTPIQMKKGRPGQLLSCLCKEAEAERFARLILQHTTTIGVRMSLKERWTMDSDWQAIETPHGQVRMKHSSGHGADKQKLEHDDLAAYAQKVGLPLWQAEQELLKRIR